MKAKKVFSVIVQLAIIVALIGIFPASAAPQEAVSQGNGQGFKAPTPKFSNAVAFDKTAPCVTWQPVAPSLGQLLRFGFR